MATAGADRNGGIMIVCGEGGVHVNGNTQQVAEDFMNIMNAVRTAFYEDIPEEKADEIISLCGQLVYSNDEGKSERELRLFDIIMEAAAKKGA